MSLYDECVEVQLKLEAAQTADAGMELLARGQRLVETLEAASTYLEHAAQLPAPLSSGSAPDIDDKKVAQAVGAFRGGLSRHGVGSLQHQPAAALVDIAKAQREQCVRWVKGRWRAFFTPYESDMERAVRGRLVGDIAQRVVAESRASTLGVARGIDPVDEPGELQRLLGGQDFDAWLDAVRATGNELRTTLERLDAARNAMTPEVREALQRAASDDGLALSDLTPELLVAIRAAGVDDQLVVRHQ